MTEPVSQAVVTEPAKVELLRLMRLRARRRQRNKLAYYEPYPKQREFHDAGAQYRERMLKAGNQQGKTLGVGFEMAMHLTGRYPDWWQGRCFRRPVAAWASGVTGESTRDNPQRILLGRMGAIGTGSIPADCIAARPTAARGIADAVDTVLVKHASGGTSVLAFKSYEKGREKWQGETLDIVWFDEEPPEDIYSEGLSRTNATGGIVMLSYTPLLGMSRVTCRYLKEPSPDRVVISMTINDALHYTEEERERIIASYPAHEREARVNGVPMLGSGRIFPLPKEAVAYDPGEHQFPSYFRRICGIDFGWDHPTAVAWIAYDADADTIYVYDAYRRREESVIVHAAAMRARGDWIPVAWPHDGHQHDKGSGHQLADQYRAQGINMLHEHAQYPPTGADGETRQSRVSVEAGVSDMLDRMQTGRLKVASHLNDWWEEFLMYHREEGKIVKEVDDLICATRYALMMIRHAKTKQEKHMPQTWRHRLKVKNRAGRSAMSA